MYQPTYYFTYILMLRMHRMEIKAGFVNLLSSSHVPLNYLDKGLAPVCIPQRATLLALLNRPLLKSRLLFFFLTLHRVPLGAVLI